MFIKYKIVFIRDFENKFFFSLINSTNLQFTNCILFNKYKNILCSQSNL